MKQYCCSSLFIVQETTFARGSSFIFAANPICCSSLHRCSTMSLLMGSWLTVSMSTGFFVGSGVLFAPSASNHQACFAQFIVSGLRLFGVLGPPK